MNTRQLQEAIDKLMAFCITKDGGYPQDRYRESASKHLEELLVIQRTRAAMATTPRITLQDIK